MKRGGNLKRSRMKPARRAPRPSLVEFHEAVCRNQRCALGNARCSLGLEAHHFLPKQKLKDLPEAYVDPRNGVCLCPFHHAQVEWGRIDCPRPPLLDEFLDDHGLLESGRPDPRREEAA